MAKYIKLNLSNTTGVVTLKYHPSFHWNQLNCLHTLEAPWNLQKKDVNIRTGNAWFTLTMLTIVWTSNPTDKSNKDSFVL